MAKLADEVSVYGLTDVGRCRPANEDAFMISDLEARQRIQSKESAAGIVAPV